MKPNIDYNDMFNSGGMSFEQPPASLYTEYVDPISSLELERDKLLDTLEADKEVFLGWLTTINIKHISTLKMETLQLLVSCWLASKKHYSYINQLIRSNNNAIRS
jgi:hypothetical protein